MDAALALKQRAWKQKAQHNIRVLLTALKGFKSKYEDFSASAEKTLSEVSNNILLEHTILPSLQFPNKDENFLAPLIPAKSYLKMKTMRCLKGIKEDIAILYMDLNGVRSLLQEAYYHFSPDINWHAFMPIFTSMHYPKILDLSSQIVDMLSKDLDLKSSIRRSFDDATDETFKLDLIQNESQRSKEESKKKDLEPVLTTYMTCWMLNPYINDALVESYLASLQLDLTNT